MNNNQFLALLYREWLLSKKKIKSLAIGVLGMILLLLLLMLSAKFGNVSKLSDEIKSLLLGESGVFLKLLPVMLASSFVLLPVDTLAIDAEPSWERFRRSTPLSCYKLALVKSVEFIAVIILSTGLSLLVSAIIGNAIDFNLNKQDVSLVLVSLVVFSLMSTVMQIGITYFKSMDKAGISMCIVFLPLIFIVASLREKKNSVGEGGVVALLEFCERLLPFISLIFLAIIVIQFISLALLFRRREN